VPKLKLEAMQDGGGGEGEGAGGRGGVGNDEAGSGGQVPFKDAMWEGRNTPSEGLGFVCALIWECCKWFVGTSDYTLPALLLSLTECVPLGLLAATGGPKRVRKSPVQESTIRPMDESDKSAPLNI